jgi:hypothetical protein
MFKSASLNPVALRSRIQGPAKAGLYAEVTPRRDHTGGKQ